MKKTLVIVCAWMLFAMCKQPVSKADAGEYVAYMNDPLNGLLTKQEIGPFSFEVQYRTPEYMALMESGKEGDAQLTERIQKNEGLHYFLFRMESKDKQTDAMTQELSSVAEYNSRTDHLASGIEKKVWLVEGNDTLPCMMHHYEKNYHMASYHNVLFVFESKEPHGMVQDKTLMIDDDMLPGVGKIQFTFTKENILAIPQLNLQR